MDLRDLIEVSRHYGRGSDFVISGGGNTSVKGAERMAIKASGAALRDVAEAGFVELLRAPVRQILSRAYSADPFEREAQIKADLMASRADPERGGRPSVEASLHEMLEWRFVVHTHPFAVNALTCAANAEAEARALFGDTALFVPYTDPGYRLAMRMHEGLESYRARQGSEPRIVLMQNHGLVVAADTIAEILALTDGVLAKITTRFKTPLPTAEQPVAPVAVDILPALRTLLAEPGSAKIVTARNGALAEHFMEPARRSRVSLPLIPDNIVYCKSAPLFLDPGDDPAALLAAAPRAIQEYRGRWGYLPKIVLIPGIGVIAAEDTKRSADTCREVFEDLMKVSFLCESFGGARFLAPREIEFLDTWEVENYRRAVAKSASSSRRMEGKVAVITGAAQGFGRGIAEGLFREGANVVIADVNETAGRALEDALNASGPAAGPAAGAAAGPGPATAAAPAQAGLNRALFVAADVSSFASLQGLARQCVQAFGGVDLLVSNAGILRAGSLEEMSAETFELMTKVNYIGYFLCVKALSPLMKLQHRFGPARMADIIQINSKSGLEGSNKNSAYAGGKFGGIGLTQSFALELVEHGVKVNSICPGNFFEGPLWADPEKGLFVQYLRAGKVPGAKHLDDVRRFYESRVPMGRGCRVEDVLKAILYLVDQEYETGQALPVTGGQVMLR
jgi:NAD(P)-dependent dehydrogenase (short-subunit alcohol dehydrogenase family)/rhamnose utilization protein RhaD (predicted bifunctional aldolase and dehydrogenase)